MAFHRVEFAAFTICLSMLGCGANASKEVTRGRESVLTARDDQPVQVALPPFPSPTLPFNMSHFEKLEGFELDHADEVDGKRRWKFDSDAAKQTLVLTGSDPSQIEQAVFSLPRSRGSSVADDATILLTTGSKLFNNSGPVSDVVGKWILTVNKWPASKSYGGVEFEFLDGETESRMILRPAK
jgi:hypothetical protein